MDSDSTHCISKEFTIEVLKLPKVTFKRTPPDTTIYLSNPFVTVSFSDTVAQEITHWDWDFGDKTPKVPNLNPVTHAYSQTGLYYIQLHFWDTNDCDSTVTDQIKVQTAQIFIPNAFIPGTGDLNGHLQVRLGTKDNNSEVDLSMVYLSNEMIILNRWGNRVYEKANYMSGDWDGGNLSAGVYYYIFKCHGEYGDDIFKGAVVLKRP
jgi:PKD repeat protein